MNLHVEPLTLCCSASLSTEALHLNRLPVAAASTSQSEAGSREWEKKEGGGKKALLDPSFSDRILDRLYRKSYPRIYMRNLARAAWNLRQTRRLSACIPGPCIVHKRGTDILHDPWFNKVWFDLYSPILLNFTVFLGTLFCWIWVVLLEYVDSFKDLLSWIFIFVLFVT